jgi:hypothetical protein
MPICIFCGADLDFPEDATVSFPCLNCGNELRGTLRYRRAFTALGVASAVALRFVTLIFNPSINARKLSDFAAAQETLVVRILWKTKLIKIDAG